MFKMEFLERHKNKIFNSVIILVALLVSLKIYQLQQKSMVSLLQQKKEDLRKNEALENINRLEEEIYGYKKVFIKKDIALVMNTLSGIAKDTGVRILSIKPAEEKKYEDYFEVVFPLSLSVSGYHELGDFISRVESDRDLYLVDEVEIGKPDASQENEGLIVNLKVGTVFFP